ncbi:hypothetical protein A1O1_05876 [Capronia coronata CBS 617.96]|uniref:Myb-like domain-containing protein n=1 Tax=Capronia coronata CBS 617.96 TaxID=1182541 RepID=W9XYA2_9EURO|nr:uncharacterized protein A1O1_05876 [Capronia coronata CBS 617.96]EXJ85512.1 hypothetical protein A1O1_05876 [Capronia coronata CBS 617.96]
MNGITEPLPGLLDDPQFQITDLPALTDFQIAPLRNPAPTRHGNIPLPLEPGPGNILNTRTTKSLSAEHSEKRRAPKITPNDVLLARESKKPHLAISELLEDNDGQEIAPTQLPSFISLSVVEKSPIQAPAALEYPHFQKRLRVDLDNEHMSLDLIRRLPRPAQKDERQKRPAPMLPAMVTGLHEPPPSAALLPSIDVESRPGLSRANTTSKIHVKDMLTQSDQHVASLPTAPSTVHPDQDPAASRPYSGVHGLSSQEVEVMPAATGASIASTPWKDNKPRRARRKWSEEETKDLLAGVRKYGIGKWKQILDDPSFSFSDRSSVDLKDRYRVCANNDSVPKADTLSVRTPPGADLSSGTEASGAAQESTAVDNSATSMSPSDLGHSFKRRRKRRAWTALEDANLLKGVAKHGFQWTTIHDDVELDLQHRRATDLRDRIRTKYPDGYKHAESAPLRSDMKRAEKVGVGQSSTTCSVGVSSSGTSSAKSSIITTSIPDAATYARPNSDPLSQAHPGNEPTKTPASCASVTMLIHSTERDGEMIRDKEKDRDKDWDREKGGERDQQPGVTLPSFTLDVEDDMDWEDNRLPPLHEWDEIGI